jgi:hypothetical protein
MIGRSRRAMRLIIRSTATAFFAWRVNRGEPSHRVRQQVLLHQVADRPQAEQPVEDGQRHLH